MRTDPPGYYEKQQIDAAGGTDPIAAGEAALKRAKLVAQRIAERVQKVMGDTQIDHPALPSDGTDEQPPLSE